MPPHEPSASWRRTIQRSARASARRRSGASGLRSYARSTRSRRPSHTPRREGSRCGAVASGSARAALVGAQLVQAEGQRSHRAVGFDDRQRHDRLARPAGEVVDVQRDRRGQQDDLGRERRHPLPRPQAEQREPHVGEHARALQAALAADELGRGAHVRVLRRVAGEPQRPVGLDRRRQLAGAAVEVRPRAVGALLGADPRRRALGLIRAADPEELAQQHVLRVHRDVRLQLAPPPAGAVLQGQQVLARELQRHLRLAASLQGQLRHAENLDLFDLKRQLRTLGPICTPHDDTWEPAGTSTSGGWRA